MTHLEWYCGGESVRGASHHRQHQPNQDAIAWFPNYPEIGHGAPLIVAVSDGHGSAKNFRSQVGAQKAVEVAIKVLSELFLDRSIDNMNLSTIHDIAQTRLPQRLVKEWTLEVEQHWQEFDPHRDPAWHALIDQDKPSESAIAAMPQIAYGATLLTVLITDAFLLYVQLGDGDILCVNALGQPFRPVPRDPRLLANETTSLCSIDAWKNVQVRLVPFAGLSGDQTPALILLTTDGYANSFASDAAFCEIGRDYLDLIAQSDFATLIQQIPAFLEETSQDGSGDDITIGLIYRTDFQNQTTMIQQPTVRDRRSEIDALRHRYQTLVKQLRLLWGGVGLAIVLTLALIPLTLMLWFKSAEAEHLVDKQGTQIKQLQQQVAALSTAQPKSPESPPQAAEPDAEIQTGANAAKSLKKKVGVGP